MNKRSKLWQTFLAVSIAALTLPAFVQGQTAGLSGSGSANATSSSGSSNPEATMGSRGTSETITPPSNDMPSSGSSSMRGAVMSDQGMTEADRNLNNSIRGALNADSSMSVAARDVRMSTDNGVVTLHGTVATEKEKSDIEAKLQRLVGVKNVKNELQIAPHPTSASSTTSSSTAP